MTGGRTEDWDPGTYARFRGLRLRPALDLLAQVPPLPDGPVVDLGCGDGAVGPALRQRVGARRLIGLDSSAAMLAKAAASGAYDATLSEDAAEWRPEMPPALIFSNAALHWLPDHGTLMPALARLLMPGGTLAVQMPAQWQAPSHALARRTAADLFPAAFADMDWTAPVDEPHTYHRALASLGALSVWETTYLQSLAPVEGAHPVRRFTEATVLRPILARLSEDERPRFLAAYEDALAGAYPPEPSGVTLFPFRRLFFVLTV